MNNYKVKLTIITNDISEIKEYEFEDLEQAINFAESSNAQHAKIYSPENTLLEEIIPGGADLNPNAVSNLQ